MFLFAIESGTAASRGLADTAAARGLGAFVDQAGENMREDGLSVWRDMRGGNISRRVERAKKKGVRVLAYADVDEFARRCLTIKRLGGEEKSVSIDDAAGLAREWSKPC